MVWECNIVYKFYDKVARILSIITGIYILLSLKLFLLGATTRVIPKSRVALVHKLITAARMVVPKHWKSKDYISEDNRLRKC